MSPEMPPSEKVSKLFFVLTLIGAALWIGSISFFVLSQDCPGGDCKAKSADVKGAAAHD